MGRQDNKIPSIRPFRYNERKPVVALSILKIRDTDQEIEPFFERWDQWDRLRRQLNWKRREQDIWYDSIFDLRLL
jgi:hypothetical protein